ncbi:enoyl-CoA hydratase-related protein [Phreatobacter sp.]|uniref:enoyl-CoA hydratase-related protein n=1 Tax=Phreatobacter sp. TaxID=1966341 RepID=UPI003F71F2C8
MAEVRVDERGAALWLTIDREDRRNALDDAVLAELIAGVEEAGRREGIRAVVITGAGTKVFCAGGNLKSDAEGDPFRGDPNRLDNPVAALFRAMEASPVATIARVNGHALGGGFGLVCACDFAIAADHVRLGTPEVTLGLFPLMILPAMLRTLSRRDVMRLSATGKPVSAAEGVAIGAVNEAVPAADLDARVEALVTTLAGGAPTAMRFGRRALNTIAAMPYLDGVEYAQRVLPLLARTDDAVEGFRAFNERRPPRWAPPAGSGS